MIQLANRSVYVRTMTSSTYIGISKWWRIYTKSVSAGLTLTMHVCWIGLTNLPFHLVLFLTSVHPRCQLSSIDRGMQRHNQRALYVCPYLLAVHVLITQDPPINIAPNLHALIIASTLLIVTDCFPIYLSCFLLIVIMILFVVLLIVFRSSINCHHSTLLQSCYLINLLICVLYGLFFQ